MGRVKGSVNLLPVYEVTVGQTKAELHSWAETLDYVQRFKDSGFVASIKKKCLCKGCGLILNLDEFYVSKKERDGRDKYCKVCRRVVTNRFYYRKPFRRTLDYIKQRCENPNHPEYAIAGGVGIRCLLTEMDIAAVFKRDLGYQMVNPQLTRIDRNGHYAVDNVKYIEQVENSKLTSQRCWRKK